MAFVDKDKRQWAIEQAIKLHTQHGSPTETVIAEARRLLEFIDEKPSPQPLA